jgi:thiamine-phosphate pyrophosphorylase
MLAAWRIIDANYNRAREALRTAEDVARFGLDSSHLSGLAKSLRHTLTAHVERLDASHRLLNRDTPGDVGTRISTSDELTRSTLRHVAAAACSRLSEALRSLEEACKCIDPAVAAGIEQVRYQGYTLEQQLLVAMPPTSAPQWRLCVLISQALCTHASWLDVAARALEGGADCLQLREKDMDGGELVSRGKALVQLAARVNPAASLIINDRVDVALLCGAHGVHLGQTDLSPADARRVSGDSLLIGLSTSSIEQANQARMQGADYCGVGPMFPTTTKHKPVLAGPAYLAAYHQLPHRLPYLAIGGISPSNLGQLADCQGVAVSSCVCSSSDPAGVCRELRRLLPS